MKKMFVFLMSLLLYFGLFAGEQPVVAVYHFENETTAGKYRFSDNTLRNIEEKLRSELIKTQRFEVMSVDSMEAAIAQHKAESYNSNRDRKYQIELGRKISARYIVIGKIRNDEQYYTIFAEMIDTQREVATGAGNADFTNNKESRDKAINSIVVQLLDSSKNLQIRQQESEKRTVMIGNLVWSSRSPNTMTWSDAKIYCEKLEEDGFDNWRLPNIDELRTLIKNSPKTETGGSCKVKMYSCLSVKCSLPPESCHSDEKKYNYYSKLKDNGPFWSSSKVEYDREMKWITVEFVEKIAWVVNFESGSIGPAGKLSLNNVRCVR